MKYMVVACYLSYAVVLNEEGRFLKVANRHYEVGQIVTEVIEMQIPQAAPQGKKSNKFVYALAATAACLMLAAAAVFQTWQMTHASVYMTINPEIRIDVTRRDIVVGLDGVNADGENLIEGYSYKNKDLNLVMDELLDRAIDMGYLYEGGQISLVLDAENNEWVIAHTDTLPAQLNEHLDNKLSVTIQVTDKSTGNNQIIIIPSASEEKVYDESDYEKYTSTVPPSASTEDADSGDSNNNHDDNQTEPGDLEDADDDTQSNDPDDESDSSLDDDTQSNDAEKFDEDRESEYTPYDDADDENLSDYSDPGDDSEKEKDTKDNGQSEYDPIEDSQSNYDQNSDD